jgi:hypothetical protein
MLPKLTCMEELEEELDNYRESIILLNLKRKERKFTDLIKERMWRLILKRKKKDLNLS